jgi:hypothetical protein
VGFTGFDDAAVAGFDDAAVAGFDDAAVAGFDDAAVAGFDDTVLVAFFGFPNPFPGFFFICLFDRAPGNFKRSYFVFVIFILVISTVESFLEDFLRMFWQGMSNRIWQILNRNIRHKFAPQNRCIPHSILRIRTNRVRFGSSARHRSLTNPALSSTFVDFAICTSAKILCHRESSVENIFDVVH